MVEVPAFFNKIDFFGRLLPGYVVVTLFLVLFNPEIIGDSSRRLLSTGVVSFDLFSAIVFIVAGPAVGFTLTWLARTIEYFLQCLTSIRRSHEKERITNYIEKYSALRVQLNETDQARLDLAEAEYDFCISTLLGLLFIVLYSIYTTFEFRPFQLLLVASSVILLIGARWQKSQTFGPLLYRLFEKYDI